jgi:hypothetical protein
MIASNFGIFRYDLPVQRIGFSLNGQGLGGTRTAAPAAR